MHRVDNRRTASNPKNLIVLQIKERQRRAVTGALAQGLSAFPSRLDVIKTCKRMHADTQRLSVLCCRQGKEHTALARA